MNDTIKSMLNHVSVRNYDTNNKITKEQLDAIINAARHAPTSINGQAMTIINVSNLETRQKITDLVWKQQHIMDCSDFLVFVLDFNKSDIALKKHNKELKIQESIESIVVGSVDIGIALGTAIAAAESIGLGTVPIGAIRNAPEEIAEILKLPKNTFPVVGLCIGNIKGNKNELKPRMPMEGYMLYNEYNNHVVCDNIEKYDNIMADYFLKRGEEGETWSSKISEFYSRVYFPKVYDALKKQGFSNNK
jgi:FMN reductase [NAD(P)H]